MFAALSLPSYSAPITSANVTLLSGPQNLTAGALTSNSNTFLILERTQFVLPAAVTLDTLTIGVTNSTLWPGTSTTLAAGTVVDVWLFHVQRSGFSLSGLTSTIDFGAPVLGYAGRSFCGLGGACVAGTDVFGNPGSSYATNVLRGLELLPNRDSITQVALSSVSITAVTNTFTLDEVRIFTESQPEPGTWVLTAIAFGVIAAARRIR
ncbi:MAG: hypothetical protein FJW32_26365 [Acidobacteria bacterium]|nr:hypothetical protein [Acidobacteriota bacterium]